MITSLLLSAALFGPAAPLPKEAAKPEGPAPMIVDLKPDANGKIMLRVMRQEKLELPNNIRPAVQPPNGVPVKPGNLRERIVSRIKDVELKDLKDLRFYQASGKELDKSMVLKKLENGGVIVISTDGNMITPSFSRILRDDTIVMVTSERIYQTTATSKPGVPGTRPGIIRPLPIQILPAVPGQPVKPIQIQIQGGNIQVLPAQILPAPEVDPLPAKKKD